MLHSHSHAERKIPANAGSVIISKMQCTSQICKEVMNEMYVMEKQGSHFSGLTKFHDFSRFISKFPGIFPSYLK